MRIIFTKVLGGECVARLHRRDGVVVELLSYSRKYRVPHDLAHFVTERELLLSTGVFGSLAAGAMFHSVRVVSGKPRHDAAARSKRILIANRHGLTVAEVLAGALHHVVEHRQPGVPFRKACADWGIVEQGPFPWTEEDIGRATDTLRDTAARWETIDAPGSMDELWPDVLTSHVPADNAR
jgi:hypothetical protein